MKKNLSLALLSWAFLAFGQAEKKNIVKSNVTAYAFRNINLTYERSFSKMFSANVAFSAIPDGEVPFLKSFLSDEDYNELGLLNLSSFTFTLEPRIYLGKGYGKGFYLAPYYRNSSFRAENFIYNFSVDEYLDAEGNYNLQEIPLNTAGKLKANSFGLMIGTQVFLNKSGSFIMDLWIIGGHYGRSTGHFDFVSNRTLTTEEQLALKEDLENLDIPVLDYEVTTTAKGAHVKVNGPWAGVRSGVSLGYRF